MNRKQVVWGLIVVLAFVLCACSANEENRIETDSSSGGTEHETEPIEDNVTHKEVEVYVVEPVMAVDTNDETIGEKQECETFEDWQSAYKYVICNAEKYLADTTGFRVELGQPELGRWAYLGVHDFEEDGIPEFIIGDSVTVSVFTYGDGTIEKIKDLVNPWGGINGLHFKNNMLCAENDGSDGSCYLYFGYYKGNYVTGVYDDYQPDKILLNGERVSYEEFCKIFGEPEYENVAEGRRQYLLVEGEGEALEITYTYNITYNSGLEMKIERTDTDNINDLDFDKIVW